MLHKPAQPAKDDPASAYKARIGVYMFIFYALIYVGFVAINLINPKLMENVVFGGLNLAVVYGFGLIIFALFQAMIYNHLCTTREAAMKTGTNKTQEVKK